MKRTICVLSLVLALTGCRVVEKDGEMYIYPSLGAFTQSDGTSQAQAKKAKPQRSTPAEPVAADRRGRLQQLGRQLLRLDEARNQQHVNRIEGLLDINKKQQKVLREMANLNLAESWEILAQAKRVGDLAEQEDNEGVKELLGKRMQRLKEDAAVYTAENERNLKELRELEAEQEKLEQMLNAIKAGPASNLQ